MEFLNAIQKQIDDDKKRCIEHGWTFKDRTRFHHTIGDLIRAVMSVDNEADAQEFYRSYIKWLESRPKDANYTATQVADANIGWCFGEGMSNERQAMWAKCTTASHPIFGRTVPSAEETFSAGQKQADRG